MDKRITDYGIGALARLSGVSIRTLHHYDRIGLLCPRRTGSGRYRRYGRAECERLQEILFYRAAGLSLAEIALLLAAPADRLARLRAHAARLAAESDRLSRMQAALAEVIVSIETGEIMTDQTLYHPFTPEAQADHEAWLVARGGPAVAEVIGTARQAVAGQLPALMAQLQAIEAELATAMRAGQAADDTALQPLMERHRALIARFWGQDCSPAAYAGLAGMYRAHPGFGAHFDAVSPGLSGWLPAAVSAHAARLAAA